MHTYFVVNNQQVVTIPNYFAQQAGAAAGSGSNTLKAFDDKENHLNIFEKHHIWYNVV